MPRPQPRQLVRQVHVLPSHSLSVCAQYGAGGEGVRGRGLHTGTLGHMAHRTIMARNWRSYAIGPTTANSTACRTMSSNSSMMRSSATGSANGSCTASTTACDPLSAPPSPAPAPPRRSLVDAPHSSSKVSCLSHARATSPQKSQQATHPFRSLTRQRTLSE